ncbi:DUF2239 family protein [Mesorhizobium sp. INR15]|uniref:DUF2239 family protein n=1 Tax=Mesorhizobium sp. INR15 TaxID=2654248 RepID=UPI00189654E3|nr:DUF2239 family protein [Mesorhizobium sp. INR15]QPC90261.1 DUF2239 family protein [Mesorhizobium sp. INR15]
MSEPSGRRYTAFEGNSVLLTGALIDVALAIRSKKPRADLAPILVFDDATGAVVDLDLRGSDAEIAGRLAASDDPRETVSETAPRPSRGRSGADARVRGRPKLGVVAREVTLLPRQWEWLASQPGGASQALRRLVDEKRRSGAGQGLMRTAREAAYRFMSATAGNLPGFEEAVRALFAGDEQRFERRTEPWPADIRAYALKLAAPGLSPPKA